MGIGSGLYMYIVVVQKFTFAISSPDEFLSFLWPQYLLTSWDETTELTFTLFDSLNVNSELFYFCILTQKNSPKRDVNKHIQTKLA